MKINLAIAVARRMVETPTGQQEPWVRSGIWLANNGEYMTGPRDQLPPHAKRSWTFRQFLEEYDWEYNG
jgi:hypothetical protein